jgi:hypothetical protein
MNRWHLSLITIHIYTSHFRFARSCISSHAWQVCDGEQSLYLERRSITIRRLYLEQTWPFSLATPQCFLYIIDLCIKEVGYTRQQLNKPSAQNCQLIDTCVIDGTSCTSEYSKTRFDALYTHVGNSMTFFFCEMCRLAAGTTLRSAINNLYIANSRQKSRYSKFGILELLV